MLASLKFQKTRNIDASAKHSFFKNSELKKRAFSHLDFAHILDPDSESGVTYVSYRQCLLNVALTCKDFLDEALDILWRKLDSFLPLLKVLPALLQLHDEDGMRDEDGMHDEDGMRDEDGMHDEDGIYVCANARPMFSFVTLFYF